jgi:hypothetical protein
MSKVVELNFPSRARFSGKVCVINVPKNDHEKIRSQVQEPFRCQVRVQFTFPKNGEAK